jgi:hypothetical protein
MDNGLVSRMEGGKILRVAWWKSFREMLIFPASAGDSKDTALRANIANNTRRGSRMTTTMDKQERISHCLNAGIAYEKNAMDIVVARATICTILDESFEEGRACGYKQGIGEEKHE